MSEAGRSAKPVVFLAFADSVEANLPRLADELRLLRSAFAPAVKNGWCEVVERANVSLDDILAVFQEYRDKIVLFHYGGHSTSYQLLLNASAGKLGEVNAGGFAEFLSHQRNLQLVFLNGCSNAGQVDALLDAGVGAVIATAEDIRDDAAVEIAKAFYGNFATGQPLQTAYGEAVAAMRARYGEDVAETTPWQLRIRPETNYLRQWNLATDEHSQTGSKPDRPASVTTINTSGGTYIAGNLTIQGDFIGRDKIIGNKIEYRNAPPTAAATPDSRLRASWQQQIANYRDSLRLIEERMSDYVLSSDVPLQLVRERERILVKIAELEARLANG